MVIHVQRRVITVISYNQSELFTRQVLDIGTKMKLMLDVSRGVLHLHDRPRPIIHRDLTRLAKLPAFVDGV